jgi:hypothetical protein
MKNIACAKQRIPRSLSEIDYYFAHMRTPNFSYSQTLSVTFDGGKTRIDHVYWNVQLQYGWITIYLVKPIILCVCFRNLKLTINSDVTCGPLKALQTIK